MIGFITITVQGMEERIQAAEFITESGLYDTRQAVLEQVSEFMANEMRRNAHVITGKMRDSINSEVLPDMAIVEVTAPYAAYENRRIGGRQGPHDFADRAVNTTAFETPNIIKREYDNLFSRI